jgi:hypothetical protein
LAAQYGTAHRWVSPSGGSARRFRPSSLELGLPRTFARLGGNMIGPCDEGGATGRCQRVKPTFDPLEPTIDIALKNFGGVRSKGPKVPRTTRRAGQARWPRRAPVDDRRSFVASESTHPRWDPPCGDDARRCANAICHRASASAALARPHVDPAVGGDGFGQGSWRCSEAANASEE